MRTPSLLRTLLLAASLAASAFGLPTAAHAGADAGEFDAGHAAWTKLLAEYNDDGAVDYARWKREGTDGLQAYLDALAVVTPEQYATWNDAGKIAFWINVYNASMIDVVLDEYPIEGVKDIGSLLKPYAVFDREFIALEKLRGKKLSLNDVEHEILRKDFQEPRVHFAIVCASQSCPVLDEQAFREVDLDTQLAVATRRFLADDFRNRADAKSGTLYLSKIFKWFGEDFEKGSSTVRSFVAKWAAEPEMKTVASDAKSDIDFLDYDWSLNQ